MSESRRCGRCKAVKPVADFGLTFRRGAMRRQSWCKVCFRAYYARRKPRWDDRIGEP